MNMSLTFSEEIYGLRCLTPLPTIFQLYHGGQFYRWRKQQRYQLRNIKFPQRGRCGRDRMVDGFTTTCAISAYQLRVRIPLTTHMARCTQYNIMR
jgi:hypothetical protein